MAHEDEPRDLQIQLTELQNSVKALSEAVQRIEAASPAQWGYASVPSVGFPRFPCWPCWPWYPFPCWPCWPPCWEWVPAVQRWAGPEGRDEGGKVG